MHQQIEIIHNNIQYNFTIYTLEQIEAKIAVEQSII
jgi:hypothetical protein